MEGAQKERLSPKAPTELQKRAGQVTARAAAREAATMAAFDAPRGRTIFIISYSGR